MPQKAAETLGYAQNLWLHGPEHYVTEVRLDNSEQNLRILIMRLGRNYEHVRCVQN